MVSSWLPACILPFSYLSRDHHTLTCTWQLPSRTCTLHSQFSLILLCHPYPVFNSYREGEVWYLLVQKLSQDCRRLEMALEKKPLCSESFLSVSCQLHTSFPKCLSAGQKSTQLALHDPHCHKQEINGNKTIVQSSVPQSPYKFLQLFQQWSF